jgi:hypothetical protein
MASLNSTQLDKLLEDVNYPASKAELMKQMERNGADESICAAISSLPNQTYENSAAVNRAISSIQQSNMGNMRQGQDQNHQNQSQQGKQKTGR